MAIVESFAIRLKDLRDEKKLTQEQLAKELGVSRVSLSYYEKQERTPDIEVLYRIATYFNVSTDFLLGLSEYRNETQIQKYGLLSDELNYVLSMLNSESRSYIVECLCSILTPSKTDSGEESHVTIVTFESLLNAFSLIKKVYEVEIAASSTRNSLSCVVGDDILGEHLQDRLGNENYSLIKNTFAKMANQLNSIRSLTDASMKYIYHINRTVYEYVESLQGLINQRYNLEEQSVPPIMNIEIVGDKVLLATFEGGAKKRYDMQPMLDKKEYRNSDVEKLNDNDIFRTVKIDKNGRELTWSGDIGLFIAPSIWNEGISVTD